VISNRLCALAAAICLSVSAGARPQGNSIRGKVRDSMGRNVGQIIVQLETGNGVPVNIIATNNEGDFFFGGLSETSYILVISAPDFEPVSEHVDFVRTVGAKRPWRTADGRDHTRHKRGGHAGSIEPNGRWPECPEGGARGARPGDQADEKRIIKRKRSPPWTRRSRLTRITLTHTSCGAAG
jgi:hypothetical protein